MPSLDFSDWRRAQECIAQGALTNSKNPKSHVFGVYPTHIKGGGEAYVYDTTGRRYLDYICGLGVNLFGYGFPRIAEEISRQAYRGFSHSLPTTEELDTAEALKMMFYFTDQWKFLKSGSEACSAAIRIARAHTGRDLILSEGYHGWHDDFVSLTKPATGVPSHSDCVAPLNHNSDFSRAAAVIIEPVIDDYSNERAQKVRSIMGQARQSGALVIFDEVITGFRFQKGSVAQYWNLYPDLIIVGKAMAQGLPLAAVGGKKEVMSGDYFVSSTYAGEILSLIACRITVDTLMNVSGYKIDRLWEAGERFIDKFNKIIGEHVTLKGYPTRGVFYGDSLKKALFFQEAVKAGYLFCNSWFYNFPLMKYDDFFFSFLTDFKTRLELGSIKLEGDLPASPFAQRVRDGK